MFETIRTLLFGSIISPAILLLMTTAVLYFLWGVVRFIINSQNPEGRTTGAQHMIWGIIGLAIMISAFGLLAFVFNSVKSIGGDKGIDNQPVETPSIIDNPGF